MARTREKKLLSLWEFSRASEITVASMFTIFVTENISLQKTLQKKFTITKQLINLMISVSTKKTSNQGMLEIKEK